MPNQLINETSLYLLQHSHNPVNWYPWGEEALQKAIDEDKPILVSIGYAACHWCHVMEKESFEDETTAKFMNENFINIKIDREERPDLDHIYMDAVQSITGSGGWPLNVFLTPAKEPFFGGTYFPPKAYANRPSWMDILKAVANTFIEKRTEIEQQANRLTDHLVQFNIVGSSTLRGIDFLNIENADAAVINLLRNADKVWGGFSNAPKFPQTFSIKFLLRYYHLENNRGDVNAENALQQALLSLDKMIEGGIYDQLGGGFARYATDKEWLAPHFEKMLYDNALLVSVLSEAYQLTGDTKYKKVIAETISFIEREMMHEQKGFYAALDADSEGEEGKFYVWNYEEVKQILSDDADIFMEYYDISVEGNWEGENILRILKPLATFAAQWQISINELETILQKCKEKLLTARAGRERPLTDDKIILAWNALMNIAYSNAFAATSEQKYCQMAIENMQFLLSAFLNEDGSLMHVWKNNIAKFPAFLDDYANLIQALLQLHRITVDTDWLIKAKQFCEKALEDFSGENGYFYYTGKLQKDVIFRKKEVYDGATPSGNAMMAQNLHELGILFDKQQWIERSRQMVSGMHDMMVKYPTSYSAWLCTLYQMIKGTKEIVLMGDYQQTLYDLLKYYLPHSVIMASEEENDNYPLLKGKAVERKLTIYVCENDACRQPVYSIEELRKML